LFQLVLVARGVAGIDQVSGTPVALNKTPGTVQVDGIPGVPETAIFKRHSRLITGTLAEPFDHNTMKTGVAANQEVLSNIAYTLNLKI